MLLEEAAVRYVYKDFAPGTKPTIDDIKALNDSWDDEYAESAFCNTGDFGVDDLKAKMPASWKLEDTGRLDEGECRIAIISVNYNGERQVDFECEDVRIEAFDLCGLMILNAGEKNEDVFGEEWYSEEPFGDKTVLFMYRYPNLDCEPEVLEAPLDEFEESFSEWIDCIDNPPTQEDLDEKNALLKSLFG
jgi:hypothetical protein